MDRDRLGPTTTVRRCARPACSSTAAATLAYDYKAREVWISDLGESNPATHDLCAAHADRLNVPRGWDRHDLRRHDAEGGANLRLAV